MALPLLTSANPKPGPQHRVHQTCTILKGRPRQTRRMGHTPTSAQFAGSTPPPPPTAPTHPPPTTTHQGPTCRKSRGTPRWAHSWMKWAPLSAASAVAGAAAARVSTAAAACVRIPQHVLPAVHILVHRRQRTTERCLQRHPAPFTGRRWRARRASPLSPNHPRSSQTGKPPCQIQAGCRCWPRRTTTQPLRIHCLPAALQENPHPPENRMPLLATTPTGVP